MKPFKWKTTFDNVTFDENVYRRNKMSIPLAKIKAM